MLIVPATWEAEAGGQELEASLGYIGRPYLKSKGKQKGWEVWLGVGMLA
jgi:hypothetical protein